MAGGERPAHLKEAVTACREALNSGIRERAPLEWAKTQTDLGVALSDLGQLEGGMARHVEAVEAFREALKVQTRERAPLDWATT